jgi:hypothetical protein
MADMLTRYVVGQVVNDQTYGPVTILEIHEATINSPEQFNFTVNATGALVRGPLLQVGESAQAAEVETAVAAAEAAATPLGT